MFHILNTIVRRAHRIYGIPNVVLEFLKIQFTETNPELSEIGELTEMTELSEINLLGHECQI